MKYIIALIFSIYSYTKDFGYEPIANFVALGYHLQRTPANTIAALVGGMLPTILIWIGVKWLIKKIKAQKEVSLHTQIKQTPQSTQLITPATPVQVKTSSPVRSNTIPAVVPMQALKSQPIQNPPESNDDLWAQALAEYDSGNRKQGLYARSFSEALGEEAITKSLYLRYRVSEYQSENTIIEKYFLELSEKQTNIFSNLKKFENNPKDSLQNILSLIRLLDGQANWGQAGLFSNRWEVNLKGTRNFFSTDALLKEWALKVVIDTAKACLPQPILGLTK